MDKDIAVSYDNKFCYNIIIRNNFNDLLDHVSGISGNKYRKVCIVSDSNVAGYYLETVKDLFAEKYNHVITHIFEAGEKNKQLSSIESLYQDLIEARFERPDLLVALGGGVVGDMTGFAAATYLRGIDFIQIPTTLLSQVDSSIGGKTGVDFLQYKNMVGAFYMPRLVYINLSTLCTLPEQQLVSGMGEVIKHGLIMDREYYDMLPKAYEMFSSGQVDTGIMGDIVYGSCMIKRAVVEEDPKETGLRRILNFGHTFGHAVEKLSDFALNHGHCVALGSVSAAYISLKRGMISREDYEGILDMLQKFGLPISVKAADLQLSPEEILVSTKSDKKMSQGKIRFVLLEKVGKACVADDVTDEEMLEAIKEIL